MLQLKTIAAPQMMLIGDAPSASGLKPSLLVPAPALAALHKQSPAVAAAAEKQFCVPHRPAFWVVLLAAFRILLVPAPTRLLVWLQQSEFRVDRSGQWRLPQWAGLPDEASRSNRFAARRNDRLHSPALFRCQKSGAKQRVHVARSSLKMALRSMDWSWTEHRAAKRPRSPLENPSVIQALRQRVDPLWREERHGCWRIEVRVVRFDDST